AGPKNGRDSRSGVPCGDVPMTEAAQPLWFYPTRRASGKRSRNEPGDKIMPRLNFGAFLAPHHPVGENPLLQFRRDLDLVEQLDWMSGGRAIFGSGPGALASDAHTLGIDPMTQRDQQDEAIGIIRRLMRGERVTAKGAWYTLQDAALQLLPLQEDMPFATASQ